MHDIDIVFKPNGDFDDVYLYVRYRSLYVTESNQSPQEDFMEADFQAIVSAFNHIKT